MGVMGEGFHKRLGSLRASCASYPSWVTEAGREVGEDLVVLSASVKSDFL